MEVKRVGFTGTRTSMSTPQRDWIVEFVSHIASELIGHHGDCVGADEQFDDILRDAGSKVVVHPPIETRARAFVTGNHIIETKSPKLYLARNHDIVNAVSVMIAAPLTADEKVRSGTWATIRFARKQNKRLFVITPEGEVNA